MTEKRAVIYWFLMPIVLLILYPSAVLSQTVSVQNGLGEYGFGWMFGRNGSCYVVMPRHVSGPFPRVTITTAAPVENTSATVVAPFWEGIDLALGVARGNILERCTATLDELMETRAGLSAAQGDLLRLSPSGEVTRSKLRFTDRNYLSFTGYLNSDETSIAQGTSGAFVFVDGRPIGMAISSDDPARGLFMRSGEIFIHVSRFLDEQGGAYIPAAQSTGEEASQLTEEALPLRFVESSVAATNPRFAPENMVGAGQFVFKPQRVMRFVFGFDEPTAVSRIVLKSTNSETQTNPKDIILRWSVDSKGERFRELRRGQMGPDGVFDTGDMAKRNIRYLEVIALNTWGGGDVVIDEVTAH